MSEKAIAALRALLSSISADSPDEYSRGGANIRDAKAVVLARYQPVSLPENLDRLTADEFRGFLLFRNNQHWELQRQAPSMTADMPLLIRALKLLLDEAIPVRHRLDRLRPPNGNNMVRGLGRAVITAILQVAHPDRYGVLNNTAERGMKSLGLWPDLPHSSTFGERYEAINCVLLETASIVGVDLWICCGSVFSLMQLPPSRPARPGHLRLPSLAKPARHEELSPQTSRSG